MASQISSWCAVCVAAVACTVPLWSAQLQFEVASIRKSTSLGTGGSMRFLPDGGIRAQHVSAGALIRFAYELQPYQLVGAPDWTRDVFYDIEAKPGQAATREQTRSMVQALLVDRFKLAFHRERRELDGFALTRVRANELGPNLQRSGLDCVKEFAASPQCREGGITSDAMKMAGGPISTLVQLLVAHVGGPVGDETRLAGAYDVDLRWSDEVVPADDRQSIYTAIQEQLGLKLERRRVASDVLVVDRLEPASPN
jgi:uncharacterized protein (TIGR03435 family)